MSAPSHDVLWLIPISIFTAGLLGSPHCMSMCGPIVLNFAKSARALAFYQFGRMLAYVLVGALLGAFGEALLGREQSVWVSGISLISIATLLLINGYRTLRNRPLHYPLPDFAIRLPALAWKHLNIRTLPKSIGGFVAGVLTVLLPCGHLYSFLIGATATGTAWKGAGFMFAFWLGSTPLLSFGSVWMRHALNHRSPQMQRTAGALLVLAGLFSVLTFGARAFELYQARVAPTHIENQAPHCH